jgi:6,7-dimethyl-8-ribityllumazine synthase
MAKILIVEARFYPHLNDMLLDGARNVLEAAGHGHETITVPGALEVPGAIALAAKSGRYCGFVALGVVIRGETYHFELVSNESARGLMALTLQGFAIGNGILTVGTKPKRWSAPTRPRPIRAAARPRQRWRWSKSPPASAPRPPTSSKCADAQAAARSSLSVG